VRASSSAEPGARDDEVVRGAGSRPGARRRSARRAIEFDRGGDDRRDDGRPPFERRAGSLRQRRVRCGRRESQAQRMRRRVAARRSSGGAPRLGNQTSTRVTLSTIGEEPLGSPQ
jgi:hypothetical protein